jgi:hypothetical protein
LRGRFVAPCLACATASAARAHSQVYLQKWRLELVLQNGKMPLGPRRYEWAE